MIEVERIVTVLKPTQTFLKWLKTLPNAEQDLTLDNLRSDCTALLIPSFDSPEEADEFIEEIYEEIFANELETWCDDTTFWPKELSYTLFTEWFDLEHNSMVYDVADDLEEDEEDDEEGELDEDELEDDEEDDGEEE